MVSETHLKNLIFSESMEPVQNDANHLVLTKRGVEYTPFNKFFIERFHGNKFTDGPAQPKPENQPENQPDTQPEIPPKNQPEAPPKNQPETQPEDPSQNSESGLENSSPKGNGGESGKPDIQGNQGSAKSSSPALPAENDYPTEPENTASNLPVITTNSTKPENVTNGTNPEMSQRFIQPPSPIPKSPEITNSISPKPVLSLEIPLGSASEENMVPGNTGIIESHINANFSLFLNSTLHIQQVGKGQGISPDLVAGSENPVVGSGIPAPLEVSPELVRENLMPISVAEKLAQSSLDISSTITTTLTKYIVGKEKNQGTRTELRRVTETVCAESAPCTYTKVIMESPLVQDTGKQPEGKKIPEKVSKTQEKMPDSHMKTTESMVSPSPTLTTTLTATITIKKLRTYDSTIVSETCSTTDENRDDTKTIKNAAMTNTSGNGTHPRPVAIYEGSATVLVFDFMMGSMCAIIFLFF